MKGDLCWNVPSNDLVMAAGQLCSRVSNVRPCWDWSLSVTVCFVLLKLGVNLHLFQTNSWSTGLMEVLIFATAAMFLFMTSPCWKVFFVNRRFGGPKFSSDNWHSTGPSFLSLFSAWYDPAPFFWCDLLLNILWVVQCLFQFRNVTKLLTQDVSATLKQRPGANALRYVQFVSKILSCREGRINWATSSV